MILLNLVSSLILSLCLFIGCGLIFESWLPVIFYVSFGLAFVGGCLNDFIQGLLVNHFNKE